MNKNIVFENEDFSIEKLKYDNGRPGLKINDKKGFSKALTVNPDWLHRDLDKVIVRDYGSTKGMYNFLQQQNIVGNTFVEISIGINKGKRCKLLV